MSGNAYKFTGRVVAVGKTERLGKDPNRPFYKRTAVIDDASPDDKYPNPVPFEATGEYCSLFDQLVVGAQAEVSFYINGREWKDKKTGQVRHFCANRVLKVVSAGGAVDLPMSAPEPPDDLDGDEGDGGELPF